MPPGRSTNPTSPWERRGKWIAERFGMTAPQLGAILDTAMRTQGTATKPAAKAGAGTKPGARKPNRTKALQGATN
jgi:hypothetical protein